MNKAVLDASAILAILNKEPGAEKLTPEVLNQAVSSTVNLAEVKTKMVNEGEFPTRPGKTLSARSARLFLLPKIRPRSPVVL